MRHALSTGLLAAVLVLAACGNDFSVPTRDGGGGGDGGGPVDDAGNPIDGGGGPSCKTLAEGDCNARTDCVADYCSSCTCSKNFRGCRAPSDPLLPCPALGCAEPICGCRTQNDCSRLGQSCSGPDDTVCGGACMIPIFTCTDDSQCQTTGGNDVCDYAPCNCSGQKTCVPGCTGSDSCKVGETCGSNSRCVPQACGNGTPCPINFTCLVDSKTCARKICGSDSDCSGNYCVNGECHSDLGMCMSPAP